MSVLKVENLQFSAGQFELRANFSLQHRVTGIFWFFRRGKNDIARIDRRAPPAHRGLHRCGRAHAV